jgi:hypothetical protein
LGTLRTRAAPTFGAEVSPASRTLNTFAHFVGNHGEFNGFLQPTIWLFAEAADRDVFAGREAARGLHMWWRC